MYKLFPVVFPLILLALTFSGAGHALANAPALIPGPVILTDGQGGYLLGLHLEILEFQIRR